MKCQIFNLKHPIYHLNLLIDCVDSVPDTRYGWIIDGGMKPTKPPYYYHIRVRFHSSHVTSAKKVSKVGEVIMSIQSEKYTAN